MHGLGKLALWATAFLSFAAAAPLASEQAEKAAAASEPSVTNKYIVSLKPGIQARDHIAWVEDVHKRSIGKRDGLTTGVEKTMSIDGTDFTVYSGSFDDATIESIKQNSDVLEVEQEQIYTLQWIEEPTSPNEPVLAKKNLIVQRGATWGLSAISHRSGSTTTGEYIYDSQAGVGTFAYVVDSGARATHNEFQGRVEPGYNALPQFPTGDRNGHGTHVAGTVMGRTYGVAKGATLVPVKAFEGRSTTTSAIIDSITWSINDVVSKRRQSQAAINLSLGGGFSSAMNRAVETGFSQGVVSAIAAGNSNVDASRTSPASAPNGVTVGSITSSLRKSSFSNFGRVLDLFAPGSSILSAGIASDSDTRLASGTSMASPHVCGVLLYFQSVNNAGSASGVTAKLLSETSDGVLIGSLGSGSPNSLAYNGNGN